MARNESKKDMNMEIAAVELNARAEIKETIDKIKKKLDEIEESDYDILLKIDIAQNTRIELKDLIGKNIEQTRQEINVR